MASPNYKNAKDKAAGVIAEYGITSPVVPIYDIAEAKGLVVKTIRMPDDLRGVSGFLDPEKKIIYVNAGDPINRQTFTVAHELGHYLLNHDPKKYGVLLRFPEINSSELVEKEANCFAANLLVPKDMLQDVMSRYSLKSEDQAIIAQIFGVSKEVIKFRLNDINHVL